MTASRCGTNVSFRWSITACPPSSTSKARRGADPRYTTDRTRSSASRAASAPRSLTPGRRSAWGTTRRSSTRPRMTPFRAAPSSFDERKNAKNTKALKDTKVRTDRTASRTALFPFLCVVTPTFVSLVPPLCPLSPLCPLFFLEPENHLTGTQVLYALQHAAVARVVLKRELQQQIA